MQAIAVVVTFLFRDIECGAREHAQHAQLSTDSTSGGEEPAKSIGRCLVDAQISHRERLYQCVDWVLVQWRLDHHTGSNKKGGRMNRLFQPSSSKPVHVSKDIDSRPFDRF